MIQVLKDFGFASLPLTEEDFLEAENIIQLGFPPNQIDIVTSVDGIQFSDCRERALLINIDGLTIHLIDIEKLIENKTASGRLQDLADVEALKRILKLSQSKDSQ